MGKYSSKFQLAKNQITHAFQRLLSSPHTATSDRLFGAVKVESFRKITLPKTSTTFLITTLTKDVTQLILKLFPNIEQLAFSAPMDSSTAINLTLLLIRWKNISTLSLVTYACLEDELKIPIAAAINGLTGLKRLDLGLYFDTSLLSQTLARLHHLSLGFKLEDDDLLEVIRQIGPHCTRLWIRPYTGAKLSISNVQSWMKANVQLFSRLTHFGCSSYMDIDLMKFIDAHFLSLHVWYIPSSTKGTFAEMGHVSRLNELRVLYANGFLPMIGTHVTEPMRNVNFFEFRWSHAGHLWIADTMIEFCTKLAWLLPNVEHMILVFNDRRLYSDYDLLLEIIKEKLFMFKNLRKCQLRILFSDSFSRSVEHMHMHTYTWEKKGVKRKKHFTC